MSANTWSQNLKLSWKNILISGLAVALAALLLSLIQPFEYRSTMRFTVSQRQFGFNQDAYAAAKSSEKLARNIADTINSRAFLEDIFNSGFGIERAGFPADETKMRKAWEEKVSAKTQTETGMLTIEVYDTAKARALQVSEAITYVLNTKGADYHGGSRDVQIKRIDDPLVSKWPARPNLPINLAVGFTLGVLAAVAYYFLKGAPSAPATPGTPAGNSPVEKEDELPAPIVPIVPPTPEPAPEPVAPVAEPIFPPAPRPIERPIAETPVQNNNFNNYQQPADQNFWHPMQAVRQVELPKNWLFED